MKTEMLMNKTFRRDEIASILSLVDNHIEGRKDASASMKTRAFQYDVKKVEETGELEGYGSVFGNRDVYNEVVEPGAFVGSLVKHKREGSYPLMLWQHNPDFPIGKWDDLAEDKKGLYNHGRLAIPDVSKAVEVHALLKLKAINGLSIGYRELDVVPAKDGEPRRLVELELMEVSIVSFPANRRARVEAVKMSAELCEFAQRLRAGDPPSPKEFEDLLRDAGVPKKMACQIASVGYAKAIRSDSEGNEEASLAVKEALERLQSSIDGFTLKG